MEAIEREGYETGVETIFRLTRNRGNGARVDINLVLLESWRWSIWRHSIGRET
jgi:hypothetical protein